VLKAMAREAVDRYPTAAALAEDLRRFLDDRPILARRSSMTERFWRWCRQNPSLAATGSLAALAGVTVVVLAIGYAFERGQAVVRAEKQAEELRKKEEQTQAHLRQTQRLSAELALDRGQLLCERGEINLGMLWLARSLELAPADEKDLHAVARASLASWRQQLLAPRGMLPHAAEVRAVAMSPDGKTVLAGAGQHRPAVGRRHRPAGWTAVESSRPSRVRRLRPDRRDCADGASIGRLGFGTSPWAAGGRTVSPSWVVRAVAFSPDGKTILTG
jgi:hypothetical protein